MLKKPHSKRIEAAPKSNAALSQRGNGLSVSGGKKRKPKEILDTLPAKQVASLTTPPPLPPEISESKTGRRYWKKYWSYLIQREQAVSDFGPTITSLCMLRIQFERLYNALDAISPLHKLAIPGQRNLLTASRNITALEAEHGFTLNTHAISQSYDPKINKGDEPKPKSTNSLADRTTTSDPYTVPNSSVLFDDDE